MKISYTNIPQSVNGSFNTIMEGSLVAPNIKGHTFVLTSQSQNVPHPRQQLECDVETRSF